MSIHLHKILIAVWIAFSAHCNARAQPSHAPTAETVIPIEQKIGSMLIVGFRGTKIDDPDVIKTIEYAKRKEIGGVILFGRNIVQPDQLRALVRALRQAQPSLLIAVDQEGGRVQRLSPSKGFQGGPSPYTVSHQLSLQNASSVYEQMASELQSYGFNLNFAPSVDLHSGDSTIIGQLQRSYSEEPDEVIQYAGLFIDAHRKHGVMTSIKHFPGHGFVKQDTHRDWAESPFERRAEELQPYRALMEQGKVDMIMVAHLFCKEIDDEHPVTLSSKVAKKILREEMHFNGVLVSDDMHMGSVLKHYNLDESVQRALQADLDLLVFSNNPDAAKGVDGFEPDPDIAPKIIATVKRAIAEKNLPREKIEISHARISTLQQRFSSSFHK